ncbi:MULTISPECIES: alpha/beta hydrolase [unclassified Ligilactobacillus]|uniref:alpha/beta hydrolase n=1 Tax=unclassified Ligilactobacillus TaxID=2767920 RepID=UPI0038520026
MTRRKWGQGLSSAGLLAGGSHWLSHHASPCVKPGKWRVPVLFIPGYRGNRFSFGPMIRRFVKHGWGAQVATVWLDQGRITRVRGELATSDLVQVLFVQNRGPVEIQVSDLRGLLRALYHLGRREVQVVAHSMGGVALLHYLVTHNVHMEPVIQQAVTIAAPFNDTDPGKTNWAHIEDYALTSAGPTYQTPRYRHLQRNHAAIPATTRFLNVYGELHAHTDGSVGVNSARALQHLVPASRYQEHKFTGLLAQHSLLHQNAMVDRLIATFLGRRGLSVKD